MSGPGPHSAHPFVGSLATAGTSPVAGAAADVDALTGLPARSMLARFDDRRNATWSPGPSNRAALFVDIDNFRYVNDSLGHEVGDRVLVEIGRRVAAAMRQSVSGWTSAGGRPAEPFVVRFGSDTFAILLDDVPSHEAVDDLAAQVQRGVVQPLHLGGERFAVQCSVGIAVEPAATSPVDDLVRSAATAMHEAKRRGKGQRACFVEPMRTAARRRLQLESDLRTAIAAGQLDAVYQPIVNLDTGRVASFEALARWRHPLLGPIPPDEFIPLAEETGLVVPLAHTLLCRAVDLLERLGRQAGGEHVRMNVNVSRRQLADPTFLPTLTSLVRSLAVPPERLSIEVTESVVTTSPDSIRASLVAIKALGVQIHLDDFGTGLSSLSLLRTLPLDGIKVDRSFIDAAQDREAIAILHAIITLGRNLRKITTAEGLETMTHMATVLALECDMAQGFLLGRPVDAARAADLLTTDFSSRVAAGRVPQDGD